MKEYRNHPANADSGILEGYKNSGRAKPSRGPEAANADSGILKGYKNSGRAKPSRGPEAADADSGILIYSTKRAPTRRMPVGRHAFFDYF